MVSVNLIANTNLRTPEEFRQLVVKEENGVVVRLGDDRRRRARAPRTTTRTSASTAQTRDVHGHLGACRPRTRSNVIKQVREAHARHQAQLPAGMKAGIPYDSTGLHPGRHPTRSCKTLTETLLIVVVVIFLFLGSVRSVIIPVVAIPISLIGAVFLMLAAGLHHQPADPARHRALGRASCVDDAIVMVENVERHLHTGSAVRGRASTRPASWSARSSP